MELPFPFGLFGWPVTTHDRTLIPVKIVFAGEKGGKTDIEISCYIDETKS